MTDSLRRARVAVLVGIVLASIGRAIDLAWHARHPEFETGMDQVQAHSVAWTGAALLLVASAFAVRHPLRTPGFITVLVSACLYAVVAVWHFLLHVNGRDPDLPHVLLALSQLGLYAGSVLVVAGLFIPRCNAKYAARAAS